MMETNDYQTIIDILTKTTDEQKLQLFVDLVRDYPSAVIDVYNIKTVLPFEKEIRSKQFVEAIKFYREQTNASLKEAKEYVENIFIKHGKK